MRADSNGHPKILVVEPCAETRNLLETSLGRQYKVIVAQDGLQAVRKYREEMPDIILMAHEMPKMSGLEACRFIKALDGDIFTPVLFISERETLEVLHEGIQSGAEDILAKPINPDELTIRVHAALRTKNLYNQLKHAKTRIERERDLVAEIQQGFLTKSAPDISGLDFFFYYRPSSKAGGDYYDFIQIDSEHLGILIADVSGHGTPAAVVMAMARIVLHSQLTRERSPALVLERLNQILWQHARTGNFITAFYGVIHLPTLTMRYASAGHLPGLLTIDSDTLTQLDTRKGFPLMVLPDNAMEENSVTLARGNKIILLTDGLVEARNPAGDHFGMERFRASVLEYENQQSAQDLGSTLIRVVDEFAQGFPLADDATLLVVDFQQADS